MVQITDLDELKKWLKDQPPEVAVVIALRAALRVLPMVNNEFNNTRNRSASISKNLLFKAFRGLSSVWLGCQFRNEDTIRNNIRQLTYGIAKNSISNSGRYALHSMGCTISSYCKKGNENFMSALAIEDSLKSVSFDFEDNIKLFKNIIFDVKKISEKNYELNNLVFESLWYDYIPDWVLLKWEELKRSLYQLSENWMVWTNWYSAVLVGMPAWGTSFDRAEAIMGEAVLWPDADWEKGADFINPRLQALVDEAKALPEQNPTATCFKGRPREPIRIARCHPGDGLTNTSEQRDWHNEVCKKIANLKLFSPNALGPTLANDIDQFSGSLGRSVREGRWIAVWSTANTLRRKLAAHDTAPIEGQDPARLQHDVAETLRDLVETYNQFVIGDEKLSARDAQRFGPQERETVEAEVKLGKAVIKIAVKADRVFDLEAREELQRHLANADAAEKNIHGDQALEQSRKTMRNAILEIAKTGRDEIRHAMRKTTEGVYSEAGKTIFTKLKDNPSEVVTFISQNGQALIDYATQALHSPALVNIVEQVVKLFGG